MSSTTNSAKGSSAILWTGRVLSGVVVLFFLMDAGMKLADVEPVREAQQQLGWPLALDRVIGLRGQGVPMRSKRISVIGSAGDPVVRLFDRTDVGGSTKYQGGDLAVVVGNEGSLKRWCCMAARCLNGLARRRIAASIAARRFATLGS